MGRSFVCLKREVDLPLRDLPKMVVYRLLLIEMPDAVIATKQVLALALEGLVGLGHLFREDHLVAVAGLRFLKLVRDKEAHALLRLEEDFDRSVLIKVVIDGELEEALVFGLG